jgi:hypothetical protein
LVTNASDKEGETMRQIYPLDQRVGPDPVGYYVYLWRHGDIDRYVGKGTNGRWEAHTKPRRSDHNQSKYRYFLQHRLDMDCFIIAEGLATEADAGELEIVEIDRRGLEADGTGTLLNDRRGSVINRPRGERDRKKRLRLDQKLKLQGPWSPNAVLRRGGKALKGNPKPSNSPGGSYIDQHYPPPGETTTIGELFAKARADGFTDNDQYGHLCWDFERAFIEVALPDEELVMPGHILPTRELLDRLAQIDD